MTDVAPQAPLRVGVLGSGAWAQRLHLPVLSAGPETQLVGLWSRDCARRTAAARRFGVAAYDTPGELLDACDAVAIAVPPQAQPELAVLAAERGRTLLLEKPLAADLAGASVIAAAASEHAVGTLLLLTARYLPSVQQLLRELSVQEVEGADALFLAPRAAWSASSWRRAHGLLLDLGPHVLDLLEAVVGPVLSCSTTSSSPDNAVLRVEHVGGAVSTMRLGVAPTGDPGRHRIRFRTLAGPRDMGAPTAQDLAAFPTVLRTALVDCASSGTSPLGVEHGLHLQRLLASAS